MTFHPISVATPEPAASATRTLGRPGGRLAALDGMRLFAALAVMGYHLVLGAANAYPTSYPALRPFPGIDRVFAYGWLGVNLFFLISGFVICMSSWGRGLGQFFVSRVVRLYPAYWAGVLLTTAVVTVLPTEITRLSVSEVVINLTMLQWPLHTRPVDPSYWTLWRELVFYLLFTIVVWRGVTYRRVVAFCVLWTIASVVAVWTSVPALSDVVGSEYSMYFIAGTAMYLMRRFRPTILLWCIVGCSWALAMQRLPARVEVVQRAVPTRLDVHVTAVLVTLFFAMVLAVALGWLDWARWRWLTAAGALTYPLYLIHHYIGYNLIQRLASRVEKHVLLGGVALAILVAAWLVHRLVERPLARRLKGALTAAIAETSAEPQP